MIKVGNYETPSRGYVGRFNFKGTGQQQIIGELSGGERNRVHLAKVLKSGGNVLMLDEPTNDLDVETLRALEEALLAYPGCAVVISHDRWFLDRIATHILAFEGNSEVVWFEGNFQDYMEDLKRRKGEEATQPHGSSTSRSLDRPSLDRDQAMAVQRVHRLDGRHVFRRRARDGAQLPALPCVLAHEPDRAAHVRRAAAAEAARHRPGAALPRLQRAGVPALRHARVRQQSRRAVAAGVRRRTPDREVRVQLRARRRGDLLPRGADLLLAQSVPGVRLHVPAHRGRELRGPRQLHQAAAVRFAVRRARDGGHRRGNLRRRHAHHLRRQRGSAWSTCRSSTPTRRRCCSR